MDWEPLFQAAKEAREKAYAPYSGFRVGAALLTEDGTVVTGCNVENRSYGLTICAERNAVTSAVASGHKRFRAVAVVTDTDPPASPCGMCRETLAEFSESIPVLLANVHGGRNVVESSALLPMPFVWPGDP